MLLSRIAAGMFSVGLSVLGINVGFSQNFPNKPIRIVTATLGSSSDLAAREIAQGLTGSLGQQVIVDNRAIIAIETVAKAPADGYTVLLYGGVLWLSQFLRAHVSWDAVRDFAPLTLAVRSPNILVLHPSVPANSVAEFITLAKAKPGELNYGSGASGSSTHLAAELFKAMAGVNIVRIPYKGGGAVLNDLIGGQVQMSFATAASVTQHVKSGRLKALGVATAEPSVLVPGMPTIAATLPGYEAESITGMFVPAKTPAAIVNRLNQEIVRVLKRDDVRERFLSSGVETVGSSPEYLAAKIKSEMARLGKVIKDAGIREQ